MTIDELIKRFEFFDNWEDRFAYLIELGQKLEPMDPADMHDGTMVKGCQATVHLKAALSGDDPPRMTFRAIANAHIVNGLIAVLQTMYNGRSPRDVLEVPAESIIGTLGFEDHLTPTRRNGLHALIERIRAVASSYAEAA